MAVVTGYTAGHMQEIEDATIVSGAIVSGNLILTRHDGSTFDAGAISSAVPAASETVAGIVELATTAETTAGTDATRAVTPAGLLTVVSSKQPQDDDLSAIANMTPVNDDFIQRKSGVWVARTLAQVATDLIATPSMAASDTQKGLVELATNAEVSTGTDTGRAVTPAGLAALAASETLKGLVELATNTEASTGTDTVRAVTPANIKPLLDAKLALSGGTMTGTINGTLATAATAIIAALVTGSTFDQVRVYANGDIEIGSGLAGRDVKLTRPAANQLSLLTADLLISTIGRGLRVATGTNAKMSSATLAAGTVTVNNTSVTANSHIIPYHITPAGTPGFLRISAKTAATSFTILSSSNTDTSLVGYFIIEPA
jgi:hypothetical protein